MSDMDGMLKKMGTKKKAKEFVKKNPRKKASSTPSIPRIGGTSY